MGKKVKRKRPTDAPDTPPAKITFGTVLKWAGSITAILSLIFGLRQLTGIVTKAWDNRQQIEAHLQAHTIQRTGGNFAAAWGSLLEAEKIEPGRQDVQTAQEDLAMEWLRRIRVREGEQTFTDIVQQVEPVLVRGIVDAEGARKGDLLAHLGWSDFLRLRDSGGDVRPQDYYNQALEADPGNVYAHAMSGHWILWRRGSTTEAEEHFEQALSSGREREFVRGLQIAALVNRNDPAGDRELLQIANAVRAQDDSLELSSRLTIHDRNCSPYSGSSRPATPAAVTPPGELSPDDEILTLRWLLDGVESNGSRPLALSYCVASLYEAAGRPDSALVAYRSLFDQISGTGSTLQTRTEAAVQRLTR